MMSLLAAALWAMRTIVGLTIATLAAILIYGGTGLTAWPMENSVTASFPAWAYLNLAPSILSALASAFLIKIRLWTLAMGSLLASVYVLVFGAPENPPLAIWTVFDGLSLIAAPILGE